MVETKDKRRALIRKLLQVEVPHIGLVAAHELSILIEPTVAKLPKEKVTAKMIVSLALHEIGHLVYNRRPVHWNIAEDICINA